MIIKHNTPCGVAVADNRARRVPTTRSPAIRCPRSAGSSCLKRAASTPSWRRISPSSSSRSCSRRGYDEDALQILSGREGEHADPRGSRAAHVEHGIASRRSARSPEACWSRISGLRQRAVAPTCRSPPSPPADRDRMAVTWSSPGSSASTSSPTPSWWPSDGATDRDRRRPDEPRRCRPDGRRQGSATAWRAPSMASDAFFPFPDAAEVGARCRRDRPSSTPAARSAINLTDRGRSIRRGPPWSFTGAPSLPSLMAVF